MSTGVDIHSLDRDLHLQALQISTLQLGLTEAKATAKSYTDTQTLLVKDYAKDEVTRINDKLTKRETDYDKLKWVVVAFVVSAILKFMLDGGLLK